MLLGQLELWFASMLGRACVDEVILRFLEALHSKNVFDRGEGHLFKDFRRSHSLILEEVFRAKVLRDAMPPLQSHIFSFLMHELVCPAPLAGCTLRGSL